MIEHKRRSIERNKSETVRAGVGRRRHRVAADDEPLGAGVVHSRGEVSVGGHGLDFEPVVGQELGLLLAGWGLWVGVHGVVRAAHSRRTVCVCGSIAARS